MAKTIKYCLQELHFETGPGDVVRSAPTGPPIESIRAVLWNTGEIWAVATAFIAQCAFDRVASRHSLDVLEGYAGSLRLYAEFLENSAITSSENKCLSWREFPKERHKRPTYLFRGYLINRINNKNMARSTAAKHMSAVKAFYKWLLIKKYLEDSAEPYRAKRIGVRYADKIGRTQIADVETSDIAIKALRVGGVQLEDGVLPITSRQRALVLDVAPQFVSREFTLILKIGFFSGMRIGTILGLTCSELRKHYQSLQLANHSSIKVGSGTGIPTKGGVEYCPSLPTPLLLELLDYCSRPRRAIRSKRAATNDKDLVFLGQSGQKYQVNSFSHSMTKLRSVVRLKDAKLKDFYFHQTRATFGTLLVIKLLNEGKKTSDILPILMQCMGHVSVESSFKYIKFIENEREMMSAASDYEEYLSGSSR